METCTIALVGKCEFDRLRWNVNNSDAKIKRNVDRDKNIYTHVSQVYAHRHLEFSFIPSAMIIRLALSPYIRFLFFFFSFTFELRVRITSHPWRHLKERSFVSKKSRDERSNSFQCYATISSNMASFASLASLLILCVLALGDQTVEATEIICARRKLHLLRNVWKVVKIQNRKF